MLKHRRNGLKTVSPVIEPSHCHSERSEESTCSLSLMPECGFFAALRMTARGRPEGWQDTTSTRKDGDPKGRNEVWQNTTSSRQDGEAYRPAARATKRIWARFPKKPGSPAGRSVPPPNQR